MDPKKLWILVTLFLWLTACKTPPTATPSAVPAKASETPSAEIKLLPTVVPFPTTEPGRIALYPDAPLCAGSGEAHDHSLFHTLWDDERGCHYDHEHGQNPFTPEVAAAFPGFDLKALLGGVGVGHTNPSGPMENTHKHGGFKWQVLLAHPHGCVGHEGSPRGPHS